MSIIDKPRCLFCDGFVEVIHDKSGSIEILTCDKCGTYAITSGMRKHLDVGEWLKDKGAFRAMASMYYYFKNKRFGERTPCFVLDDIA